MNNKPKYTIFKNAKYALDGLWYVLRTETSFKIEVLISFIFFPIVYFIPLLFLYKLILIVTFMLILIVELVNSAIENIVDLITTSYHPLAKVAKDIGATAVLFAVILHILCWVTILYHNFL